MTTEREHSHAQHQHDQQPDRDDIGIGRVSRSAELQAPKQPVMSGLLFRKAERDANGVAAGADAAVASASSSSGSALPDTLMRKFESSLGADLSSVRVHTGGASETAAHAVGAKAYTMGQDIHFGAGQYDPHSHAGQTLLAHEVAHTVQQGGGAPHRQNKLEVSTPFDAAEHEADTAADAMVAGRSASVTMGAGVQRKVFRKDENMTPAPAADTSQNASTPATEESKQAAREKILAAQAAAKDAVSRTADWTKQQWSDFIDRTVDSPKVVWQPAMLNKAVGMGVSAGIGAAAGAASTAAKALLPEAGAIVGKAIEMLGAAIGGAAADKINGGKELDAQSASTEGRQAAKAARKAKLSEIDTASKSAQASVGPSYVQAMRAVAGRDIDKSAVDDTNTWTDQDQARSTAIAPSGNGLYQQMLLDWMATHEYDGHGAAIGGANQEDVKGANQELFGANNTPNYYALQLRMDLKELGLPTGQADAMLNSKSANTGGKLLFEKADDLEKLATHFFKPGTKAFQYIVSGGQWSITATYGVGGVPDEIGKGDAYSFLSSATYYLTTQGAGDADQGYHIWNSINAGENHNGQRPVK
ncbi:MAG: DUF4157 domain-containing protein [Kofleriaceae bacterium]